MKSRAVISFQNVFYRYGKYDDWALHGINLSIFPGEWVAIVGSNGCGKSTAARLMNGLLTPAKGEVLVFGRNTRSRQDLWDIRRMVGVVFQIPDEQIVGNTVEDDIAFGLENLGLSPSEIKQRIADVMNKLQLDPFKHHAPHTLSPGQKQKLAIAGVVAMRPKVIIFDEAGSMTSPLANATRRICPRLS